MKRIHLTIVFLCTTCIGAYAQNMIPTQLSASLAPKKTEANKNASDVEWTEDIEARTVFTSTYHSNDGQIKIVNSSIPINFRNERKELIPIDPELKKLSANQWAAKQQPYPTYLNDDGSFAITLDHNAIAEFAHNGSIEGQTINPSINLTDNTVTMHDLAGLGINKEIVFRENGVKYSYILQNAPTGMDDYLSFQEEVQIPNGYTIEADKSYGEATKAGWKGNLLIRNQNNQVVGTIHAPVCFDANGTHTIGSYKIVEKEGAFYLTLEVSSDWLTDPARVYPVVVDPILSGPTANWAGGTMPSCMIPSYNADSILVTIPGGITITELNVTASFYADPFTPAVMSQGAMYFSTSCDQTQTFTITGAPGASAGTAYLDNFNLYNPITCCFPESCSNQSFYLTYNLGRTANGVGCNTTYIRYDPATTSWPYRAVVVGKTAETYGPMWSVPGAAICSDQCELTGLAYANYGVPPYTYTHPWSQDTLVQGTNNGCSTGNTIGIIHMTIPNCPSYCDTTFTSLAIPPPVITDACGSIVTGMLGEFVPIKPTPQVSATYDTMVCSGTPFLIDLDPCINGANMTWWGNNDGGNANILDTITNNTGGIMQLDYYATAENNGCTSDTTYIPMYILTQPDVDFTTDPDPIIVGLDVNFTDQTNFFGANGVDWFWQYGTGYSSVEQNPTYLYETPGQVEVCLEVMDDQGCAGIQCKYIDVVPAEISAPNIITPNGDGINDLLEFKYLDFYPENDLTIMNRWGNVIYQTSNYQNDWNGGAYTEGTYYYVLIIPGSNQELYGFFQLEK